MIKMLIGVDVLVWIPYDMQAQNQCKSLCTHESNDITYALTNNFFSQKIQ